MEQQSLYRLTMALTDTPVREAFVWTNHPKSNRRYSHSPSNAFEVPPAPRRPSLNNNAIQRDKLVLAKSYRVNWFGQVYLLFHGQPVLRVQVFYTSLPA